MTVILAIGAIFIGLVVLMWSADRFIDGAVALALHFALPPLLVGVILLGFGTSAPEMVVSYFAAIDGFPQLAIGNVIGSNIANIGLVLGFTALMQPLILTTKTVKRELLLTVGLTLLSVALLYDGQLTLSDSIILLVGFISVIGLLLYQEKKSLAPEQNSEKMPLQKALFLFLSGMVALLISAKVLVWGAVELALILGLSEEIIGLTIVAIGTSLPELAASISAARKKQYDLTIGNILGSNLFNLLIVLPIPGFIATVAINPTFFQRDVLYMLFMTLLLFTFIIMNRPNWQINRWQGFTLSGLYIGYLSFLVYLSLS